MRLSTAADVVSINWSVGNLCGVVQPIGLGVNRAPEQVVLHGQVNPSSSRLWLDGREHSFEQGNPFEIVPLDVREISCDDFGWVLQN